MNNFKTDREIKMIVLMLLMIILFFILSVSLSTWITVKIHNAKRKKKDEILDVYKDDE